jgi:hypothetical protein
MRTHFYPICAAGISLCLGCASPTITVQKEQIESLSQTQRSNSAPQVLYYCGTKDGFDYFKIEKVMMHLRSNTGKQYRVKQGDYAIKDRFPFTKERNSWQRINFF